VRRPNIFITLLVEDNDAFRGVIKEILESEFDGMEIIEDKDGLETLYKVETLHPNLVLMDINLPGENGLKLTKKIKTKYPEIIVCILTNYDSQEYREAAGKAQADSFFTKDFVTKEAILSWLRQCMNTGPPPIPSLL
jgi:two-component system, NarL family, response regulator DegU